MVCDAICCNEWGSHGADLSLIGNALGNGRIQQQIEVAPGRRAHPGKAGRPPKKKRSM